MSDYKQTRDAAGKVTSQYDKMLRNLDDDRIEELEAKLGEYNLLWQTYELDKVVAELKGHTSPAEVK